MLALELSQPQRIWSVTTHPTYWLPFVIVDPFCFPNKSVASFSKPPDELELLVSPGPRYRCRVIPAAGRRIAVTRSSR